MPVQPIQIYLGVPKTSAFQVYSVKPQKQVTIKQMILTNTDAEDSKITVTVNTIDIMKDLIVKSGETRFIDLNVVLNESNTLSLQQEKTNAINVVVSGVEEPAIVY